MDHILYRQKVNKDKRQEYIKYHDNVWPEVLKAIKDSGIEREIIWIDGDYLYIYVMAEDFNKSMKKLAEDEAAKKWWKLMEPLLSEMPDYINRGDINTFDKVFDLEEQINKLA